MVPANTGHSDPVGRPLRIDASPEVIPMPMWGCNGAGWWMALWMLGFWALIIAGIALAVRVLRGPETRSPGDLSSAHRILDERFARGEIDEQELERRRSTLDPAAR